METEAKLEMELEVVKNSVEMEAELEMEIVKNSMEPVDGRKHGASVKN